MTRNYKYAITATNCTGRRIVISRHMTLKAAQKAIKLANDENGEPNPDYRIEELA